MLLLPLLALLTTISLPSTPLKKVDYSSMLKVENGVLLEVLDKESEEVRIYEKDHVTSIDENAFDGCNFSTIMISSSVQNINASFDDGVIINYTGSLPAPFDVTGHVVNEYACDEGFIHFWGEHIRQSQEQSICDVTRENYERMLLLYSALSKDDKEVVDSIEDGDGTIKDSVNFLKTYFKGKSSSNITKEIAQSTMLVVILVIASIGMTSIGIFYYLKDKNIIE